MKIVVTGASGFVGRHLVPALLAHGHEIIAVARDEQRLAAMPWKDRVRRIACDFRTIGVSTPLAPASAEALVHLAWAGLPDYRSLFHFETNLPDSYHFIKRMVEAGTKQVLVAGTCLEYGLQCGELAEDAAAAPTTPYGLAKNTLRLFLEALRRDCPFVLQWARLFYLHGPGQSDGSLLAQLDRAIDRAEPVFNMSRGDQLRDYLPVEEAARHLAALLARPQFAGLTNVCSGSPISVRQLVEQRIAERQARIELNLGHFAYPDYEPLAFWGSRMRLDAATGRSH